MVSAPVEADASMEVIPVETNCVAARVSVPTPKFRLAAPEIVIALTATPVALSSMTLLALPVASVPEEVTLTVATDVPVTATVEAVPVAPILLIVTFSAVSLEEASV